MPAEIGRVGIKTMAWFLGASCISLMVGLVMGALASARCSTAYRTWTRKYRRGYEQQQRGKLWFDGFHDAPDTAFDRRSDGQQRDPANCRLLGLYRNGSVGAQGKASQLVELVEQLAAIMFKMTDYVMKTAPLAIFAALASSICVHGIGIVDTYARFVAGFYLSLGILWIC
jgi:Na+/H+-dicarboxylate symporter